MTSWRKDLWNVSHAYTHGSVLDFGPYEYIQQTHVFSQFYEIMHTILNDGL